MDRPDQKRKKRARTNVFIISDIDIHKLGFASFTILQAGQDCIIITRNINRACMGAKLDSYMLDGLEVGQTLLSPFSKREKRVWKL